ncbi:hypothetical protein HS088_TW01G00179 [Tripterygium wilfordii]|uniref:XS domain-containing protein n=1 Tax=Tripterygium wilfordii TaxID=458696 RepID=A0A7J7E170_TRIWF|nr:uncharacterized protein LOC119993431 [Tripterygium wilfordii]XP_038696607.1 uncharacterized protein LOC119993431 [Tripterygium wilfordii]XP_038696686.1 uncharacterized protein LOC119993431 [Tripterygium wilfordii]KAF5752271.1 hypothetical protein HS088_TW01G00179 [Tripterygium wilfordii]
MAGGSYPKSSYHRPPPPSSSFSHRKSRWESSSGAATTSKNNSSSSNKPPDPKSSDPKHNKPPSNPATPKPVATQSPAAHSQPVATGQGQHPHPPHVGPFPFPDLAVALRPPPPPSYGFHVLERRTIALADGSVRSYFALPPGYQDLPHPLPRPMLGVPEMGAYGRFPPNAPMSPGGLRDNRDSWNPMVGPGEGSSKRKYRAEEERPKQFFNPNGYPMGPGPDHFSAGTGSHFGRGRDEMRAPKYMRTEAEHGNVKTKHLEVDQAALKKAVLHFVKIINENVGQRRTYLEDGKQGRIQCVACGRLSKEFPDTHGLIMHAYNYNNANLLVDHLGLHKALCVLMGWNYSKPPDNSKEYQLLPVDEAAANKDDLVMWPPMVIIHNTITGKGKEGRMEGLGNKAMDSKIKDLGFGSGKSKSLYGRDGHLGVTLIKFTGDESGLKEALRFVEYFEKDNLGRKDWARLQPLTLGKDDEKNPKLVKVDERTGEKTRILYGYLATATDLDKVDFDTRKKVVIESQREIQTLK